MKRNTKVMTGAAAGAGVAWICFHLFTHQVVHTAVHLATSPEPSSRELVDRDLRRAKLYLDHLRRLADPLLSAEERQTFDVRISQSCATNPAPQFRQAAVQEIQRDLRRVIYARAPRDREHPERLNLIPLVIQSQQDRQ